MRRNDWLSIRMRHDDEANRALMRTRVGLYYIVLWYTDDRFTIITIIIWLHHHFYTLLQVRVRKKILQKGKMLHLRKKASIITTAVIICHNLHLIMIQKHQVNKVLRVKIRKRRVNQKRNDYQHWCINIYFKALIDKFTLIQNYLWIHHKLK